MDQLRKKCKNHFDNNLRLPSKNLVVKWGKKLKLTTEEILQVNDQLNLRHQLGKRIFFLFVLFFSIVI